MSRSLVKSILACAILALAVGPGAQLAAAPIPLPPELGLTPPAVQAQEVDIALVLAVDVSGSIDYQEAEDCLTRFRFQNYAEIVRYFL